MKIKLFGELLVDIFISSILNVLLETTDAILLVLIIISVFKNEFDVVGLVFVLINLGLRIKELKIIKLFIHVYEVFLNFEVNLIGEMSIVNHSNQHCHHDDDVK